MIDPDQNPFVSPAVEAQLAVELTEEESIRNKYLGHEASVRSVGGLYYFGAVMTLWAFDFSTILRLTHGFDLKSLGIASLGFFLAALMFCLGRGLRAFKSWARLTTAGFAAVSVLALLLRYGFTRVGIVMEAAALLINFYTIYLLLCDKGRMVFSPAYSEIRRLTPHIRYRSSPIVQVFVFLILVVLVLSIGVAVIRIVRWDMQHFSEVQAIPRTGQR